MSNTVNECHAMKTANSTAMQFVPAVKIGEYLSIIDALIDVDMLEDHIGEIIEEINETPNIAHLIDCSIANETATLIIVASEIGKTSLFVKMDYQENFAKIQKDRFVVNYLRNRQAYPLEDGVEVLCFRETH